MSDRSRELFRQHTDKPLVGKDIPWTTIEGHLFRVVDFAPFATVEGDTVRSFSSTTPYALLTVESPILAQPALMPVSHRDEFLNFWDVCKARALERGVDILVIYMPYRGFLGPLLRLGFPRLHLRMRSEGELERYYADEQRLQKGAAREVFPTPRYCDSCDARLRSFVIRCPRCRTAVLF